MVIRKVKSDEIVELLEVSRTTFIDTYSSRNTAENMEEYIRINFNRKKLETELADINSEFIFAEVQHRIVGYLKLNFKTSQTEPLDPAAAEIERIYVLSEFKGKGIGKSLFQEAVLLSENRNAKFLWLGVWEENQMAIEFYKKQGMTIFDKHIFQLGEDKQTDLMMRLEL